MNIKSTMFLSAGKFFEKVIAFLLYFIIARKFGSAGLGDFVFQFSIASFLMVLFDFGGELFCVRYFTDNVDAAEKSDLLAIKTFVAFIVITCCWLLHANVYLIAILLMFYVDSIIGVIRSKLYTERAFQLDTMFSIGEKTLSILFFIVVVYLFEKLEYGITAMVVGKVLGLLFFDFRNPFLSSFLSAFKDFGGVMKKMLVIFKESWSYSLHGLTYLLFYQIDISLLKYFNVADSEIGEYAAAMKIFGFGLVLSEILFRQYYPEINALNKTDSKMELGLFLDKLTSANFIIAFVLLSSVIIFSSGIIELTFGSDFGRSGILLSVLAFAYLFRFQSAPYSGIISASIYNYTKVLVSVCCVLLNVFLNFFFIPKYGVLGSAVVTVLTELLFWILLRIVITAFIKIEMSHFIIIKLLMIFLLSVLFFYLIQHHEYFRYLLLILSLFFVIINRKKLLALYQ